MPFYNKYESPAGRLAQGTAEYHDISLRLNRHWCIVLWTELEDSSKAGNHVPSHIIQVHDKTMQIPGDPLPEVMISVSAVRADCEKRTGMEYLKGECPFTGHWHWMQKAKYGCTLLTEAQMAACRDDVYKWKEEARDPALYPEREGFSKFTRFW